LFSKFENSIAEVFGLIAPKECLGCKSYIKNASNNWQSALCQKCLQALWTKRTFISLNSSIGINPKFNSSAIWEYRGFTRFLIHQYKFHQKTNLIPIFAKAFSDEILKTKPYSYDSIAVIPSTKSSARKKGYSHMHLIARLVSKETKIPLIHKALCMNSKTSSQRGLKLKDRQRNRARAYSTKIDLTDHKIMLLDDVVTSGQTLHSAIQSLQKGGAKQIDAFVLARTAKQLNKK